MDTTLTRKIFSLLLAVFIAAMLFQPAIAAYLGEELPDCHPVHDDDCGYASNGECGHICELCDFAEAATPGVTAVARAYSGNDIRIAHYNKGELADEIASTASRDASGIIIDAFNDMNRPDWIALCELIESIGSPVSLTVNGLDKVIEGAACGCEWLAELSLPDTVTIGTEAFMDCENLISVSLPMVETIGDGAFTGCSGLMIYYFGDTPPVVGDNAIFDSKGDITAYYYAGDGWDAFIAGYPEVTFVDMTFISNPGPNPDPDPNPDPNPNPNPNPTPDPNPNPNPDPDTDPAPAPAPDPAPDPDPDPAPGFKPKDTYNSVRKTGVPLKKLENQAPAIRPVTDDEVAEALTNALSSPESKNKGSMTLRFINKRYISLAQMKEIARQAGEAGKSAMIHADTVVGNVVINRLYIDPAKAKRGVRLMTGTGAETTLRKFQRYTANTLAVLSLEQQGGYGMKLGAAFKLKLPDGVKADNLIFYNYDPETNRYKRINARAADIGKGYIRLETDRSGFIVISDGKLQKLRQK